MCDLHACSVRFIGTHTHTHARPRARARAHTYTHTRTHTHTHTTPLHRSYREIELFRAIDKNRDGRVDLDEFVAGLQTMDVYISRHEAQLLLEEVSACVSLVLCVRACACACVFVCVMDFAHHITHTHLLTHTPT